MVPLCVNRRSVVRLLDLTELHRSGSVDADAALDAASRTPVPRQLSSDSVARYSGGGGDPIQWRRRCPCIGDGGGGGGLIPSLAARL